MLTELTVATTTALTVAFAQSASPFPNISFSVSITKVSDAGKLNPLRITVPVPTTLPLPTAYTSTDAAVVEFAAEDGGGVCGVGGARGAGVVRDV